jgi:hypothetical protein
MDITGPLETLQDHILLEQARAAVGNQCDLFKYHPSNEQMDAAATLLRSWWIVARETGIENDGPAMTGGLAWVAVAAVKTLAE